MNFSSIKLNVRDITSIQSVDSLPEALLGQFVNDSLAEIYRRQGAGWPWAFTTLSSAGDSPTFDPQFHQALAYRTATKVLKYIADDTPRGDYFMQEYQLLIADMEKFYLSANANPNVLGKLGISSLRSIVRNLTDIYDKQTLSDGMLDEIINVANTEFSNLRDWNTFNGVTIYDLADSPWSTSSYPTTYPGHSILSQANVSLDYQGLNAVKAVHIVDVNDVYKQAIKVDSVANIDINDADVFYSINTGANGNMYITIAPEQREDSSVKVTFYKPSGRIYTFTVGMATISETFDIPSQFQMILPYRAAQYALQQLMPDDARIASFERMFATMLDAYITYDQLDHDTRSFSIGDRGRNENRYTPLFRPGY